LYGIQIVWISVGDMADRVHRGGVELHSGTEWLMAADVGVLMVRRRVSKAQRTRPVFQNHFKYFPV